MDPLRELLVAPNANVPLDVAALEVSRLEHPDLDPSPWLRELDHVAFGLSTRAGDIDDGHRFIRFAQAYLFEELGFHGNEEDYYDPRNSCLNDVLAFRTGLPITLSLVYLEVARRLAKPVYGIGAPGHFLVEYDDGSVSAFIDPFNRGRIMTRDQCLAMVAEYTGAPANPRMLPRLGAREIILRILRNLESAYLRRNLFEKAVAATDLLNLAGDSTRMPRYPSGGN